MNETRDEAARKAAYDALHKIETHEEVCGERYRNIHAALERIVNKMDAMGGRCWRVTLAGGTVMLAVIGWLANRAL